MDSNIDNPRPNEVCLGKDLGNEEPISRAEINISPHEHLEIRDSLKRDTEIENTIPHQEENNTLGLSLNDEEKQTSSTHNVIDEVFSINSEDKRPVNMLERSKETIPESETFSYEAECDESKVPSEYTSSRPNEGEVDRLLTDISELVDATSRSNLTIKDDISCNDSKHTDESSYEYNNTQPADVQTPNTNEKVNDVNVILNMDENNSDEINHLVESVDHNDKKGNESNLDHPLEIDKNYVCNDEKQGQSTSETLEGKNDGNKKLSANESAFQRLASLGVIAEEMPVVDSKENALKKLASRGAISITPAGGAILASSVNKSVSIRPMPAKVKHKPGPKSMTKQKTKKIKIDPGKSMDIDKDFNSLISFLSSGSDAKPHITSNITEGNNEDINIISKNVVDTKPGAEFHISDGLDQSKSDCLGNEMDIDVNDDRSIHETDSESHDGSKSFNHGLAQVEENDEKLLPTFSKLKNVIEEGSSEILLSSAKNVFYNKVQEFNRDMSIAALTVFSEMHQQDPRTRNKGKKRKAADNNETDTNNFDMIDENVFEPGKKSVNGITILEALSATGLRSIRYAKEIPGVKEVIANDLSKDAVETIKKNIEHNGVDDIVTTTMSDASLLMYQHQSAQEWYDAIDLDPYGSPTRFLDSAVQAVRDGGLLLVTCTDMAILAGNAPESCYVKYGAISLRSPFCHEMALRIVLQCIESHANRYGRYIVPLLSFSADFYIRLIVQVYTSPVTCKNTTSKLAMVYQCVGCQTYTLHPLGQTSQMGPKMQTKFSLAHGPPVNAVCFHCHHKHHMGGPIWSAPLCNSKFLESMLRVVEKGMFSTSKRMQGMLEVIREELPDVPLYYTIAGLCSKLHCQAIPLIDIRSAILNNGYRVSSSHTAPTAIKTNAPTKIIWDIMRCWVHMNPVSQKRLTAGSVAAAIILEPPNLIANFDIHPKARPSSSMRKLLRYQQNPEKNWGPGMRARCNISDDLKDEKRRVNQNKNKNKTVIKKSIDIIEVVTIDDEDETMEGETAQQTSATMSTST